MSLQSAMEAFGQRLGMPQLVVGEDGVAALDIADVGRLYLEIDQKNGHDALLAYLARDVATLDRLMADLCVECGTCSYVCPSKQPLVQSTHLARAMLRAEQRKARGRR